MPFDRYVSQVHLENFNSPVLDRKLHAIRKSDLKRFQQRSLGICRIEDGSTNPYLTRVRVPPPAPAKIRCFSFFRVRDLAWSACHATTGRRCTPLV